MSLRNLSLLAGSILASLTLHIVIRSQDQNLEFVHSRTSGHFKTPLLNIRLRRACRKPAVGNSPHPTALLIHGLSASKSALTQLGTELARWGVDCYLMDLPGHGESTEKFSWENSRKAIQEALQYLNGSSRPALNSDAQIRLSQLFLTGHSLGAGLAIDAAQVRPEIAGVIAISPAAARVDRRKPKNLLILLGEFDLPFVRRGAAFIFDQATGFSLPSLDRPGTWISSDGSRRIVVLPWTDHTLGIFEPRSLLEMANWLKFVYPDAHFNPAISWTGLLTKGLFCLCLLLLVIPGFAILYGGIQALKGSPAALPKNEKIPPLKGDSTLGESARGVSNRPEQGHAPSVLPPPPPSKGDFQERPKRAQPGPFDKASPLWAYGLAGALSVIALLGVNPWDRLNLMGGSYLAGFFFLTGMQALYYRPPRWDSFQISLVDLISVLLTVLLLALALAPAFSKYFVHVTLSGARLWRFPFVALSLFPFYFFDEWACRCLIVPYGRVKLLFFHFSSRLILALILILGFFVLQNTQFLIVLVLPGMLVLSTLCWCYAGMIYRKTESLTASALFSTLITAWFFSVFFAEL